MHVRGKDVCDECENAGGGAGRSGRKKWLPDNNTQPHPISVDVQDEGISLNLY